MSQHRPPLRQHPFFSPVALFSTVVFVMVLAGGLIFTGGRAFSPGQVSAVGVSGAMLGGFANHADFADRCTECHSPFKGVDEARCVRCHQNIASQKRMGSGFHGRVDATIACMECHPDHLGASVDLVMVALADFEHGMTRFSLARHGRDYSGALMGCSGCHVSQRDMAIKEAACLDCHQGNAPGFMSDHVAAYGDDCLACHDGIDTIAGFSVEEHASYFELAGGHSDVACEACHAAGQFGGLSAECSTCHEEPEVHAALFGTGCAECHDDQGWTPAELFGRAFDHDKNTRFALSQHLVDYDGSPFKCLTCHTSEQFLFASIRCSECHAQAQAAFIDDHVNRVGPACLNCHDGSRSLEKFDHSQVWVLEGKHLSIPCAACHIDQSFEGTPRECIGCHAEPEIHAGLFGTDCATCHTSEAWQPAQLTRHDFPLDHGEQGEVTCTTCHPGTYVEYTCYGCHEHEASEIEEEHREEGILPPELANCVKCHPTGREAEEGDS